MPIRCLAETADCRRVFIKMLYDMRREEFDAILIRFISRLLPTVGGNLRVWSEQLLLYKKRGQQQQQQLVATATAAAKAKRFCYRVYLTIVLVACCLLLKVFSLFQRRRFIYRHNRTCIWHIINICAIVFACIFRLSGQRSNCHLPDTIYAAFCAIKHLYRIS